MSVSDKTFKDDASLLQLYKKALNDIKFIKTAKTSINNLRDGDLNVQGGALVNVWKDLLNDAIAFLKANDERETFHDNMTLGVDRLFELEETFKDFEPILYGAIPDYRDHLVHVFRVLLLGDYLIRNSFKFEAIDPKKGDHLAISSDEKEAIWCIIALTHDLGYALQGIYKINQHVRTILQKFGIASVQELEHSYFNQFGNINDFTLRFLSSKPITQDGGKTFTTHLQTKYYLKFMSALSNFEHGVVSSVILMKDLVYFKESDYLLDQYQPLNPKDARHFLIRRDILRAIASHSCDDIYYLNITNFPFLLSVFDEMQEWGRPRLVDVTKRGGSQTELSINQFNEKMVDYKITFQFPEKYSPEEAEKKIAFNEIIRYFLAKSKKWQNVLRGAVDGEYRNFVLKFCVEDNSSDLPSKHIYSLVHNKPDDIEIIINGEKVAIDKYEEKLKNMMKK